tara:strand:+ start:718 stop:1557 length:840 start_codon:yes stop_codon:yes gene_type:complete
VLIKPDMKFSIAIPDSSLADEKTLENKTRKIASIARSCGIFRVNEIIIYRDGKGNENDSKLFVTILRYLETPQYFRRDVFGKTNLLKFAGALPPLKIPNQIGTSDPKELKKNDVREGVIVRIKGQKGVDIGVNQIINYYSKHDIGKRILVQIKNIFPDLSIKEITKNEIPGYWSYNVRQAGNLFSILSNWNGIKILTSRKSKNLTQTHIDELKKSKKSILLVFGSTNKGIHDILGNKINSVQNTKTINFFPNQGTETVRIEEAIIGSLAILNAGIVSNK